MKDKFDFKILIIIILVIIFSILCYLYYHDNNTIIDDNINYINNIDSVTFKTTSSVTSSLNEEIPLRVGYYFKEILVSDNVVIKKGEKIIKYTNGQYLTAPYDLVITKFNVPNVNKICNSSHNIEVSAYNVLSASFRVDESKMDSIYIGKEVKVKVKALDDREVEGIVTDISNTLSNGRYTVTVEFDNDGDIKLGMTINVVI